MAQRVSTVILFLFLGYGHAFAANQEMSVNRPEQLLTLWATAQQFRLAEPEWSEKDCRLAHLGRQLFFEERFSSNQKIACASCHLPELSFSDGKVVAAGLGTSTKNTPALINLFASGWLFWDGRADSLVAQAVQPLESPIEQGGDRLRVYRVIRERYLDEYKQLFGPLPQSLSGHLPELQTETAPFFEMSGNMINYGLATLGNIETFNRIVAYSREEGVELTTYVNDFILNDRPIRGPAHTSTKRLASDVAVDRALDEVFVNAAYALAAYQQGLIANQSAFDRFIDNWKSGQPPDTAFLEGFSDLQFKGFDLFTGSARCVLCHSGATLSDGQFHNIGLPQRGEHIDYGRSLGILKNRADRFNCRSKLLRADAAISQTEVCNESAFVDSENLEMLGAFKTPTLRNVAQTAPYGHDGRFADLAAVLDHYNSLDSVPAIGHTEDSLKPLGLSPSQLESLEAFLVSLTSPVRDRVMDAECTDRTGE